jgi:two-component system response regulator NreC
VARLRILLADDHTLMRQGLRRVLAEQPHWEVVADVEDGAEAVRCAVELRPDVAILDVTMPRLNGVEATKQILRRVPEVRVLILSMYADEVYVRRAFQAGAVGYLLKDSADTDLIHAVSDVARRKTYFSPAVGKVMLDEYLSYLSERGIADRYDSLSEREREVFQLIAEAHSTREIAERLHLSPGTVETHRAHIMEKLDLHSAAEIVLYAVRRGVIR